MHAYLADGRYGEWIDLLDSLYDFVPDEVTLYVGHGEPGSKELLRRQRRYVEAFVDAVRQSADLSVEDRAAHVTAAMQAIIPGDAAVPDAAEHRTSARYHPRRAGTDRRRRLRNSFRRGWDEPMTTPSPIEVRFPADRVELAGNLRIPTGASDPWPALVFTGPFTGGGGYALRHSAFDRGSKRSPSSPPPSTIHRVMRRNLGADAYRALMTRFAEVAQRQFDSGEIE